MNMDTNEETSLLTAVLDEIIPASADGRLPAAGSLGLADTIATAMRADPELTEAFGRGLTLIAEETDARGATSFVELEPAQRREALERVAEKEVEFFESLLAQSAVHYYSHPTVSTALGLRPGPPFPEGYEISPLDESLLEEVRKRAPIYREV